MMYNNNGRRKPDQNQQNFKNIHHKNQEHYKNRKTIHNPNSALSPDIKYSVPYKYVPRKRKLNFKIILGRFLISFFIALTLFGIFCLLFYFNLIKVKAYDQITYEFNKNEETDTVKYAYPENEVIINETFYIPIDDIFSYFDYTITGDKKELSYINLKDDEYIKFLIGSNVVYINDTEYHMPQSSFFYEKKLFLPIDFIKNNLKNVYITFDEKDLNHCKINVRTETPILFKQHGTSVLEGIKEPDADENITSELKFKGDMSPYFKYFSADGIDKYITLINNKNPVNPVDYKPEDLIDVVDFVKDGSPVQQLRKYPEKALEGFIAEAKANGHGDLAVTSAYRSYERQKELFEEDVEIKMQHIKSREKAEAETAKTIAYPGRSEHQTGLAVDINSMSVISNELGGTEAGKWLAENSYRFGFILRYPSDKVDITGIKYEPWHFRYVGVYHATQMKILNMCLEEYMEYLANDQ